MNRLPRLRLRAEDAEDLAVISACLQDSVVAVREMRWLRDERRFVFVANRFRWEDSEREKSAAGRPIFERVHCGVCFENVTAVRRSGLDQRKPSQIVSLLSIEAGDGHVVLVLSAGGAIRIEFDRLHCHLQDIDEPWPTQWRPAHPLEDA